jgi:hypothetical protein
MKVRLKDIDMLTEDIKKDQIKSLGLKSLGWGAYSDRTCKKYKWDGFNFKEIAKEVKKEDVPITDKGLNKTSLLSHLKTAGFVKNEGGKYSVSYKTPKQKQEVIDKYKNLISSFGENLKKTVDSKKGVVKFSNNTVHLFTVRKENLHGVNSIIVDFD